MAQQYDLPNKTTLAAPVTSQLGSGDPRGKAAFIRATAKKYNIDPEVALKVAKSEGLGTFQSSVVKGGKRENSWGAFQLYTDGGLGNEFQKATGLDPSDPKNEEATIDYALRYASQHGWGSWYGAKNTGIKEWEGIGDYGAKGRDVAEGYGGIGSDMAASARAEAASSTPESVAEVASTLGKGTDDKTKKPADYRDALGEGLEKLGAGYATANKDTVARAPSSTTVPAAALPMAPGPMSMVDPKMIEMQRQQLALAMQRLNSGKLV